MVMCGTIKKKNPPFPASEMVQWTGSVNRSLGAAEGAAALALHVCTGDRFIPAKPEKSQPRATVEAATAKSRT